MKDNELIAKFMGYSHKTLVTIYNYGMDFTHSYDEEILYSNIPPELKKYEETFGNQILDTYENYFDPYSQKENFKSVRFLSYDTSWDYLMPVLEQIEQLGYQTLMSDMQVHISKSSRIFANVFIGQASNAVDTKFKAVYQVIVEFLKYYYDCK